MPFQLDVKMGKPDAITREIERGLIAGQRAAGKTVAKVGRKLILDDVKSSRGHLRMMGGKLGVRHRSKVTQVSSVVELYASPAGPWAIVEFGTKAYQITPRKKQVLAHGKGDVVGMRADRKRRPGKPYWDNATDDLGPKLIPLVTEAVMGEID